MRTRAPRSPSVSSVVPFAGENAPAATSAPMAAGATNPDLDFESEVAAIEAQWERDCILDILQSDGAIGWRFNS